MWRIIIKTLIRVRWIAEAIILTWFNEIIIYRSKLNNELSI